MLPGLGLGADVKADGIILPTRRRLLAGWSEYEVLMKTPLSAGMDWRRRIARQAESGLLVAHGEAAHG
jgi:hypothetical protein